MSETRASIDFSTALRMAKDPSIPVIERTEMLLEIALGLQHQPKSAKDLEYADQLYKEALQICPAEERLLSARLQSGRATALMALPGGVESLESAKECLDQAEPILRELGTAEELAEAEMNRGLIIQTLAIEGRARFTDAVRSYHAALKTFTASAFPREFAIIQNNLATAYLSMPMSEESGKIREALAVQAYEAALEVVTLEEHPVEYAMLQNNLGNALQYSSSSHPVENNIRAMHCYEEALRVRTRKERASEYANTISNLANVLRNLPDDPEFPEKGQANNLRRAREYYAEAIKIFLAQGETDKAKVIEDTLLEMDSSWEEASKLH